MSEKLTDLPFINLYFRPDGQERPLFRSKEKGQSQPNRFVPEAFVPVVGRLGAEITATNLTEADGLIEFEGVRCRLSQQKMADGVDWICVRRITTTIPKLEELGYAGHIANHLHGLGTRKGLIVLAGPSGQGKTTTAASLLADFLLGYGGTAVTIESPVEYNLKGRHGENGQCFSIEPTSNDDWAVSLKRALMWAPDYIFAGELRTPKVAEILLRAATTGHTVITTVDAGAPEDALTEVLFLAEQSMGPSAGNILAQGLVALLFQTMREEGPFIRYLFTEENAPGDPIRSLIREGKITMISTYIDRIAARLSNQPAAGALPPLTKHPLPPLPKKP